MIQYLQRVLIVAIPAVIVYLSFTPYRMKALSAMRLRTSRKREVGLVLCYEIKQGKFISFRAPGQERFTRCKTLGEDYTEEAITLDLSISV